ncbi:MAG: flagellar biosynthetic protein FliO [Steroidobacter sp.]
MRSLIVTVVASCTLRPGFALAETGRFADPNTATSLPVSGVSSVGYVTVALALVLALIYGAAWLLRRVKTFNGVSKSSMNVVEAVSVGPKERVVLVRVKDQQVLLGVSPGRVNMLLDMGKIDDATPPDSSSPEKPVQLPSFKQLLKRSMGLS